MAFSTLIVDEIPGGVLDDETALPGYIVHVDGNGRILWQNSHLKMPYDAVPLVDGSYWVNIIRARAVWQVTVQGEVRQQIPVGGYPCSLQRLPYKHLLVAGWDDATPGFVREFDGEGVVVWQMDGFGYPAKAYRLT